MKVKVQTTMTSHVFNAEKVAYGPDNMSLDVIVKDWNIKRTWHFPFDNVLWWTIEEDM